MPLTPSEISLDLPETDSGIMSEELIPEPAKLNRWPRILLTLLQISVSVGLLSWILVDLSRKNVMNQLSQAAEPGWFLAGIGIVGVSVIASILRWSIFLRLLDVSLPLGRVVRIWFVGMFFDLLFFGPMGGDAIRILLVIREYPQKKTAATLTVFMDHMSGFAALLVAGLVFTGSRAETFLANPVTAGLFLYLMGFLGISVFGVITCIIMSRIAKPEKFPMPAKVRRMVMEVHLAFELLTTRWPQALMAVGISFISLYAHFASFYFSGRAVGAQLSALELFSVAPIIDVITMLPISISGLGIREKGFEHLLHVIADVPMTQATLLSLGGFACTLVWGLLGGLVFSSYRSSQGEKARLRE